MKQFVILNLNTKELVFIETKKYTIINIIVLIFILLLITIGVTFAYFTANISGIEETTTISASGGTMNITYNGGSDITISNMFPREEVWSIKTFTVTGNSTVSQDMFYNISLNVVSNTFSSGAIKYKLISTNTGSNGSIAPSITTMKDIPTGANEIFLGNGIFTGPTSGNKVHTYNLEIYFPDTGTEQNVDQGKQIKAYVKIEEGIIYLGTLILNQYGGATNITEAQLVRLII